MMVRSAGILAYRYTGAAIEFFLVHPGGPFFARKEAGYYTIPKGLVEAGEDPLAAARREFAGETGSIPVGDFLPLGSITQKGGKTVEAWAVAFDLDPAGLRSNTFPLVWPPGSGKVQHFPEVDKAGWFNRSKAEELINERQRPFLQRLAELLQSAERRGRG